MGKFKLFGSRATQIMGCRLTKGNGSEDGGDDRKNNQNTGASSSANAGVSKPPPSPDPRIPMTAKQKYSIVASWKGIHRALEPTGIIMFVKLFEEHSELLNLFEKFRSLKTKVEQEESLELAEHASVVMSTLDNAIRTFDNPDAFFSFLEQVGGSHTKIPGFQKEYFLKIEKPFLSAVKTTLDERYTENISNIYQIAIGLIIKTLIQGFEKAQEAYPSNG